MICGKCWNEPATRGIKKIECVVCGIESHVNVKYANVCFDCSNQYNICQSCGENFSKPIDIDWIHVNKQGE